jgi:hypothetical protein
MIIKSDRFSSQISSSLSVLKKSDQTAMRPRSLALIQHRLQLNGLSTED